MEILGAGLCRTGTMSTRKALVGLGLDPCFHMKDVLARDLVDLFLNYFNGDKQPLIDYLKLNGVKASLDIPIVCIVDELTPHFPDAKVLLTVRDCPDVWVQVFIVLFVSKHNCKHFKSHSARLFGA